MSQSIYFGTYTKKESKGIYKAQFDPETGSLSDLELVAAEPNPTFIAFSEKGNLYSVGAQDGNVALPVSQQIFNRSITLSKRGLHSAMSQ